MPGNSPVVARKILLLSSKPRLRHQFPAGHAQQTVGPLYRSTVPKLNPFSFEPLLRFNIRCRCRHSEQFDLISRFSRRTMRWLVLYKVRAAKF